MDYFGKKGMSLLGTMEVVGTTTEADGQPALKYNFVDYIVQGYSGQDHVQVAALVEVNITFFIFRNILVCVHICTHPIFFIVVF